MRELIRYKDNIVSEDDIKEVISAFDQNFDKWCFYVTNHDDEVLFRVMPSTKYNLYDEQNFLAVFIWGVEGAGFKFNSEDQRFIFEVGCAANVTEVDGEIIYHIERSILCTN